MRFATRSILAAEPDVVMYACTSGSFVLGLAGERALHEAMREAGAPRTATTSGSMLDAFEVLGLRRLALATPYPAEIGEKLVDFVEEAGYEAVSLENLGLPHGVAIQATTDDEIIDLLRTADRPEADGIFLSCTGLGTVDLVARAEQRLGKPVLTAIQVTMWGAFRAAGVSLRLRRPIAAVRPTHGAHPEDVMTVPRELAFEIPEFRARLAAVRAQMAARGLDALVLFGPQNVCYVSGLDNDNLSDIQCVIVPMDRDPVLVLFWFEAGRAENTCWLDEVVLYRDEDPMAVAAGVVGRLGLGGGRLGVERPAVGLTVDQFERLVAHLPERDASRHAFGAVEIPRRVKSPAEIGYMRRAAALTDRAVDAACAAIDVGVSDGEIAAVITNVIYGEGGETTCLGPIVAGGYRAGAPHSSFSGRRFQAGDSIFLEFTAQVRRYTAPIMRSVWLGRPSEEVERIAEAGAAAVATIVRTARPGIAARDVALRGAAPTSSRSSTG